MNRFVACAVALAASLAAGPAAAVTANFQLLGPNTELLWALEASPTPQGFGPAGFAVAAPISATSFFPGPGGQPVQITALSFFTSDSLGGLRLFLGATSISLTGPQVFSGPTSEPIFVSGVHNLSNFAFPPAGYRLSIVSTAPQTPETPVQGIPEPTTWALMILGFGAAGAGLRRARAGLSMQESGT